ncbi:MAG: EAL domain-containing protein [Sphaerochaeta sp.]
MNNNPGVVSKNTQSLLTTLFFLCYWTLPYVYYSYTLSIINKDSYIHSAFSKALKYITWIILLSVASSPFTDVIFYWTSSDVYSHGILYVPFAAFGILVSIISALIVLLSKKNDLTMMQKLTIPIYVFIVAIANIIQIINPSVYITGAALSISTFLIFISLQNPLTYFDNTTMIYSINAFKSFCNDLIFNNTSFSIVAINIKNSQMLERIYGEENYFNIVTQVSKKLLPIKGANYLFKIDSDRFLFIALKNSERDNLVKKLESQFPFFYKNGETELPIAINIIKSDTLCNFDDTSSALSIFQESYAQAIISSSDFISQDDIEIAKRSLKIERALKNAIETKHFDIYFNPIYNKESGCIERAEASIKIFDEELGNINESEILNSAEKLKCSSKLSPIIIDQICSYISYTDFPNTFKKISISLLLIDCLLEDIDKTIISIVRKHKIDPSFLIFTIDETTASGAHNVAKTIESLKKFGLEFCLNFKGGGYSNLDTVLKLPFSSIKFCEDLTENILKARRQNILKRIIYIVKSLNLYVVVAGISDETQSSIVYGIGGNFQQGIHYSNLLSKETFTKMIKTDNRIEELKGVN